MFRLAGLLPVKIRNRKFCSSLRWFLWSFVLLSYVLVITFYPIYFQSYNTTGSMIYKILGSILTYVRLGILLSIAWTCFSNGNRKRQIVLLNRMLNFSYSKSEGRKDRGFDLVLFLMIPFLCLILTETFEFKKNIATASTLELKDYLLQIILSLLYSIQRLKIYFHLKLIKKELTRILHQIYRKRHLAKHDIEQISKQYDVVLRVCYLFDKLFRPYVAFMYLLIFFNYVSIYKGMKDVFKYVIQERDTTKIWSKLLFYIYYQPIIVLLMYTGEQNERKVRCCFGEKNVPRQNFERYFL